MSAGGACRCVLRVLFVVLVGGRCVSLVLLCMCVVELVRCGCCWWLLALLFVANCLCNCWCSLRGVVVGCSLAVLAVVVGCCCYVLLLFDDAFERCCCALLMYAVVVWCALMLFWFVAVVAVCCSSV